MIRLCCTKKLLDDLHIQVETLAPVDVSRALLGNWYAHVVRFSRRKCLLFANERSLYSFLSFGFKGGALSTFRLSSVIRKVNRMPQKNLGWKYSIETLSELLSDPTTSS